MNFEKSPVSIEEMEEFILNVKENAKLDQEGVYIFDAGLDAIKVMRNGTHALGLLRLLIDPYENLSLDGFSKLFNGHLQEIRTLTDKLWKTEPMYGTKTTFKRLRSAAMNTDVSFLIFAESLHEGQGYETRVDAVIENLEKLYVAAFEFMQNGNRRLSIN